MPTTFANNINPWTNEIAMKPTEPTPFVIASDPIPGGRTPPEGKYSDQFANLKDGQCLRVPTADIGRISTNLRKWVKDQGIKARVRSVSRYPGDHSDTRGRVWLLIDAPAKETHAEPVTSRPTPATNLRRQARHMALAA